MFIIISRLSYLCRIHYNMHITIFVSATHYVFSIFISVNITFYIMYVLGISHLNFVPVFLM
jgi:hypothetical protein